MLLVKADSAETRLSLKFRLIGLREDLKRLRQKVSWCTVEAIQVRSQNWWMVSEIEKWLWILYHT